MDTGNLFIVVIFSAIGLGYLSFGKRRQEKAFLIAGIALCGYPYLLDGAWTRLVIGLALTIAPFIMRLL